MHVGKSNPKFTYKNIDWSDPYDSGSQSWDYNSLFHENIVSMLWGSQNVNQVLSEEKTREQLYESVLTHMLKSARNSSPFTSNGV